MSCANILLNKVLISYGDTPVAAMGIAMKANMIVILLQIGLCAGIQPLIGYNDGAQPSEKEYFFQAFYISGTVVITDERLNTSAESDLQ